MYIYIYICICIYIYIYIYSIEPMGSNGCLGNGAHHDAPPAMWLRARTLNRGQCTRCVGIHGTMYSMGTDGIPMGAHGYYHYYYH